MVSLEALNKALAPYEDLWNSEILNVYPRIYQPEIENWAQWLGQAPLSTRIQFLNFSSEFSGLKDSENIGDPAPPDLAALWQKLKLIQESLPKSTVEVDNLTPYQAMRISAKKRHELARLTGHLFHRSATTKSSPLKMVDACGGQGHTGRFLGHHLPIESLVIDKDKALHKSSSEHSQFLEHDLFLPLKTSCQKIAKSNVWVGLHTCGSLTEAFFERIQETLQASHHSHQNFLALNVPCCYHRMNSYGAFSNHALHLATKSFNIISESELKKRHHLKKYRYALELYCLEFYPDLTPLNLKSSRPWIYQKDFSEYALYQFEQRLGAIAPSPLPSQSELQQFFESPQTQIKIDRLIALGEIRQMFGRCIEIAINLERLKKVRTQFPDFDCQIQEFFDRKISQRNMGISLSLKQ